MIYRINNSETGVVGPVRVLLMALTQKVNLFPNLTPPKGVVQHPVFKRYYVSRDGEAIYHTFGRIMITQVDMVRSTMGIIQIKLWFTGK